MKEYNLSPNVDRDYIEVNLDLHDKTSTSDVQNYYVLKQGDHISRVLRCNLTKGGLIPIDLKNSVLTLYIKKADMGMVAIKGTVVDATNGIVDFPLTRQSLAIANKITCEVVKTGSDASIMSFPLFALQVEDSIADEDLIESTDEFSALNEALSEVAEWESSFNDKYTEISNRFEEKYNGLEVEYAEELSSVKTELEQTNIQLSQTINQICIINSAMSITKINNLLSQNYGTYIFKSGEYGVTSSEGIVVKSNSHLIFEQGAIIVQKTLNATGYDMVLLKNVENVVVDNVSIKGERPSHVGADGEWGHGITIYSSRNITINNPVVTETWGDGIYIGLKYWEAYSFDNSNILINHPVILDCSRNGISVCSSKDVEIVSPYFKGINRTAPMSGIDVEPEHDTESGMFLGKVRVTGIMTCEDCPYPFVTHINKLCDSVVDIQLQNLVIRNCTQGFHINVLNKDVTGSICVNHISCDNINYNALMVKNKPKALKLKIDSITVGKRSITNTADNGEYGGCIWITSDSTSGEMGNIYVGSFKLDDLDSYDTALRIDGQQDQTGIIFNEIYTPAYNSYKNPFKISKASNLKVNHLYPHRDVVYGTPNTWYSTTYCKHMVYNAELTLDQVYYLTIGNDLPEGEYKVTFLSDNVSTYFLQITSGEGLTCVGFTNVQMMNRGSSVTFLKQEGKLYIIERNDITVH